MARHRNNELEFGSDSFLDIIANIVGILIILIVVAGLRAARTSIREHSEDSLPATSTPAPSAVTSNTSKPSLPEPPPLPQPPSPPQQPSLQKEPARGPRRSRARLKPPQPKALPQLDADLPRKIGRAKRELAGFRNWHGQLRREWRALNRQMQSDEQTAETLQQSINALTDSAQAVRNRLKQLQSSVAAKRSKLVKLQHQYDEAKRRADNVTTIRHKLTPVEDEVTGDEIHFRLSGGKVARVPIRKLVGMLKKDVLRRKNWLLKSPVHRGTVGPVNGFEMSYVVYRKMRSVVNELRTGSYGQVQIVLGGWQVQPAETLQPESPAEALTVGSSFLQAMREAKWGTTMTFWVYPDSFEAYRKLQAAARKEGYRVAARPLPFGMPIAGSPRGTRSLGQ